jgi:ribose transport system permease protein
MMDNKDTGALLRGLRKSALSSVDYLGLLGVLVFEIVVFCLWEESFLSSRTFFSIAEVIPDTVIVAVGMTFVLIIAGIDLSVGSVLALSQAVLGYCMVKMGWSLPVALAACFSIGLLCGGLNGLVTVRWALPSFIVTLGMLEIARGATYLVTDSRTLYIGKAIECVSGTIPGLGEITWPVLICLGTVVAGQLVLSHTVFGRYMIAIGTNEEAVRLSGINPKPVKLVVFALCGFCSALAGMIQASRMSSASPNAGAGIELTVIAAVVIGGTSLMGGRGSVVKSFLGVLIVAVLNAGLARISAPEYAKRIVIGMVIVLAVILDAYRSRASKPEN